MKRFADLFRLLAAASALILVIAIFHRPLLGRLPPSVGEALESLPGIGASDGFVAQILSEPAGAEVRIEGVVRGQTPFFGNIACQSGQEVEIEVMADGFRPWRRKLPCRQGDTLRATARLER